MHAGRGAVDVVDVDGGHDDKGDGVPTGAPPAGDNATLLRALTNGGRVESILAHAGVDPCG